MLKRLLAPMCLCSLCFLVQACSGDSGGGATGGTTKTGGSTGAAGGSTSAAGTTAAAGGTSAPAGGTTSAAGGTTTSVGGTTTAPGGSTSGGRTSAPGGTTSVTGGSTQTTGGATTAPGGTTSASGGASGGTTTGTTSAPGGTTRTGGTTAVGGTTAAGGAKTGGTTTAGGATAAGGTSATGGGVAATNEVWVSPTGSDDNPGTKDSPMLSICWDDSDASPKVQKGACWKVCPSGAGCNTSGGTIWVMDGTYKYTVTQKIGSKKLGSASGPMNLFAVSGAKPVLDFSALVINDDNRGLQIGGDYWHVKGLTVIKAGDSGIFVMGNNNTIDQCIAHDNQDMGIAIGVNTSRSGSGKDNLILNCDSYQNFDKNTGGENADGFGAKKASGGTGNIFRGCRSWSNSDDGYDFYGWTASIKLENCWAFNQAKDSAYTGSNSDGNGFKLGSDSSDGGHSLSNCIAFGNKKTGFTSNGGKSSTCTGCKSCNNGQSDEGVSGVSSGGCPSMSAAQGPRGADGSLPAI